MNEKEFQHIYERYYRRSFLFAKSYVHNDLAAEDIAVEAILKYWELVRANDKQERTEALLVTILRNKAIDYLRREMLHEATLEQMSETSVRDLQLRISSLESCDPTELFSAEIRQIMRRTLAQLPEQTRRIFELSRYENKSVKEIAIETGLSPKAVEYHITKALKALRVSLKDYLPFLPFFFFHWQA